MGRGPEPNQRQQDGHQLSVLSSSSLWISSMVSCFKPLLPWRPSCGGLYPQTGSTIPSLAKLVSFSGVELMHLEKSLIELSWFLFCFCDLRKKKSPWQKILCEKRLLWLLIPGHSQSLPGSQSRNFKHLVTLSPQSRAKQEMNAGCLYSPCTVPKPKKWYHPQWAGSLYLFLPGQ